jgi:mRNA interferase MazF
VLSRKGFNREAGHSVLAQVTTAKKSEWPGDARLDHRRAGLSRPCIVRMKLFTIDNRLILKRAGRLAQADREKVKHSLQYLMPDADANWIRLRFDALAERFGGPMAGFH